MNKIFKYQWGTPNAGAFLPKTVEDVDKSTLQLANIGLKGLGKLGDFVNDVVANLSMGDFGKQNVFSNDTRNVEAANKVKTEAKKQSGQTMTWLSPANYVAAVVTGNGLDARAGERAIGELDPRLQLGIRGTELVAGPKIMKKLPPLIYRGVKRAGRTAVNTAARAGSKSAKGRVLAREMNNVVKNTTPQIKQPVRTELIYDTNGKPISQETINAVRFNQEPIKAERLFDVDGDVVSVKDYALRRMKEKIPEDIIVTKDVEHSYPFAYDFVPLALIKSGARNQRFAEGMVNRLSDQGYKVNSFVGFDGTVRTPQSFIPEQANKLTYVGYYPEKTTVAGHFEPSTKRVAVDVTHDGIPSSILHELIMHGTDNLIEALEAQEGGRAKSMYQDFTKKLFFKEVPEEHGVRLYPAKNLIQNPDGSFTYTTGENIYNFGKNYPQWYEARSTIGELRRRLEFEFERQNEKFKGVSPANPEYKKAFNEYVDSYADNNLHEMLAETNGYGASYVMLKDNNPNFTLDLKDIVKTGAMYGVPLTATGYSLMNLYNNPESKKKGGKFNGFVKGVNVLDSDKDAYKYVKKKYKMRSAQNGDNTNNWLQKAGKWLNSDQGKAFSGLATDLISYGVNQKNINKAYKQQKETLQKQYDYIASNIDESQLKNQALENLTNLPEGQHVGMVDLLTEQEKLRREALKKQKTLADNWLANQELNLNNWMQSVQGGASDNLQSSITNFINTYGNKDKV